MAIFKAMDGGGRQRPPKQLTFAHISRAIGQLGEKNGSTYKSIEKVLGEIYGFGSDVLLSPTLKKELLKAVQKGKVQQKNNKFFIQLDKKQLKDVGMCFAKKKSRKGGGKKKGKRRRKKGKKKKGKKRRGKKRRKGKKKGGKKKGKKRRKKGKKKKKKRC